MSRPKAISPYHHDKRVGAKPPVSKKLPNLKLTDIMYFHSQGNHGNNEVGSRHFKPELFRKDCPHCAIRLQRYIDEGGSDDVLLEQLCG